MNDTENFALIGKYVLNRVDSGKFDKLMRRAYGDHLNDSYLGNKWRIFRQNELSFLVSHKELVAEIIKEINATGYEG